MFLSLSFYVNLRSLGDGVYEVKTHSHTYMCTHIRFGDFDVVISNIHLELRILSHGFTGIYGRFLNSATVQILGLFFCEWVDKSNKEAAKVFYDLML